MKLWRKFMEWVCGWFKPEQLFLLIWPGIKSAVADAVNDRKIQSLALDAVKSAAELGLHGEAAWNVAFARFQSDLVQIGKELATSVADTILQSTYLRWKTGGEP